MDAQPIRDGDHSASGIAPIAVRDGMSLVRASVTRAHGRGALFIHAGCAPAYSREAFAGGECTWRPRRAESDARIANKAV